MKFTDCQICGAKEVPLNNTLKVNGQVYCGNCLDSFFPHEKMMEGYDVQREHDPTICAFCNKDFEGQAELKKLAAYPICEPCEKDVRNKTLPLWVKGFFAAVIAVVVFAFFWNWKYYTAYKDIDIAWAEYSKGEYNKAGLAMADASKIVPEVNDLKVLTSYFRGIDLLQKDKNAEALKELSKGKGILTTEYELDYFLNRASMGAAFDRKDYRGFLNATKEAVAMDTVLAVNWLSVASAYACLYATEGGDSLKTKSEEYLAKGIAKDTDRAEKVYVNAIEYRLYSRRIIERDQFEKEFPKGWAKP